MHRYSFNHIEWLGLRSLHTGDMDGQERFFGIDHRDVWKCSITQASSILGSRAADLVCSSRHSVCTTDDTKYFYVLSALDQAITSWLKDFIVSRNGPHFCSISGPWVTPNRLASWTKCWHCWAINHLPCFLFRQLFLERLPEDMHAQLSDANVDDCRQLAQRADRIWAARQMRIVPTMCTQSQPLPMTTFCQQHKT